MPHIVDYNLTWGPNITPEDVKEAFAGPRLVFGTGFWLPWTWAKDGPKLGITQLSVTWESVRSDLSGLQEWGALGYVLLVDPDSRYLVVKIELSLEGIKAFALTKLQAKTAAKVEINFPS